MITTTGNQYIMITTTGNQYITITNEQGNTSKQDMKEEQSTIFFAISLHTI